MVPGPEPGAAARVEGVVHRDLPRRPRGGRGRHGGMVGAPARAEHSSGSWSASPGRRRWATTTSCRGGPIGSRTPGAGSGDGRSRASTSTVGDLYEDVHLAWSSGAELVYRPMADALVARSPVDLAGRRMLDVGAGTGAGTRALRGRRGRADRDRSRLLDAGPRPRPSASSPGRRPLPTADPRRGGSGRAGAVRPEPRRRARRRARGLGRLHRARWCRARVDLLRGRPPTDQGPHRRRRGAPRMRDVRRVPLRPRERQPR